MAVREFTDSTGVVWRAWDVGIEQLHPVTRGEDFMGDLQDGWLAFECDDERRRIPAPYPRNWTELPIPELEALCRSAPVVSARRARTTSGERRAHAAAAADRAAVLAGERRFTSPRGREWVVRLHERLRPDGSSQVVLRFTADDCVVDLEDWAASWRSASVEKYAMMLLDACPPRAADRAGPQRRRDDRPRDEARMAPLA